MTIKLLERWKHRSHTPSPHTIRKSKSRDFLNKVLGNKSHVQPELDQKSDQIDPKLQQKLNTITEPDAQSVELACSNDISSIISPYQEPHPTDSTINGFAMVLTPPQEHPPISEPPHIPAATIYAEDIDNLSFLHDTVDGVSHSTARNSVQNLSLQPEELTDVGSLTNAKIQVFKPHRSSRRSLKLVSPVAIAPTTRTVDEVEKIESHISQPILPPDQPLSAVFDHLSPIIRSPLLGSDTDESTTSDLYRHEMVELVNSNRALLEKKEREIAILRDLLQQERRINSFLSSPQQKHKPQPSSGRKFRPRFIPLDISITNPEPSDTKPSSLMQPFDPRPFEITPRLAESPFPMENSTPNSRLSMSSSIYFSASEDIMPYISTPDLSMVQEMNSMEVASKNSVLENRSSDNTYTLSAESLGFQRKESNSTMASDLEFSLSIKN